MKRKLGMFSPELKRDTVERLFDAARLYGFEEIQFDFLSVCREEMPKRIEPAFAAKIGKAAKKRGLTIRAVNGTFNMIHPAPAVVSEGVRRFEEIAGACEGLGCRIITLCTGTRDRENMWKSHPENQTEAAWNDLLAVTERLTKIAERYDLLLGIETEASNVVNTPERARLLLDTMKSRHLGIIFDPANLFHIGTADPERAEGILEHAFDLLQDAVILAHAKDIHAGEGISFTSAGRGIVPFERFFELLDSIGYEGPVIAHGIHEEGEFPFVVPFLHSAMRSQG